MRYCFYRYYRVESLGVSWYLIPAPSPPPLMRFPLGARALAVLPSLIADVRLLPLTGEMTAPDVCRIASLWLSLIRGFPRSEYEAEYQGKCLHLDTRVIKYGFFGADMGCFSGGGSSFVRYAGIELPLHHVRDRGDTLYRIFSCSSAEEFDFYTVGPLICRTGVGETRFAVLADAEGLSDGCPVRTFRLGRGVTHGDTETLAACAASLSYRHLIPASAVVVLSTGGGDAVARVSEAGRVTLYASCEAISTGEIPISLP